MVVLLHGSRVLQYQQLSCLPAGAAAPGLLNPKCQSSPSAGWGSEQVLMQCIVTVSVCLATAMPQLLPPDAAGLGWVGGSVWEQQHLHLSRHVKMGQELNPHKLPSHRCNSRSTFYQLGWNSG